MPKFFKYKEANLLNHASLQITGISGKNTNANEEINAEIKAASEVFKAHKDDEKSASFDFSDDSITYTYTGSDKLIEAIITKLRSLSHENRQALLHITEEQVVPSGRGGR